MTNDEYLQQKVVFKLWHGTSKENADHIFKTGQWKMTIDDTKLFFGSGIYFMLNNKSLACLWAKQKKFEYPCSILCFVEVERKFIFDLATDQAYKMYETFLKRVTNSKPSSSIINFICDKMNAKVVVGYYSLGALNKAQENEKKCRNYAVKIEIQVVVRDPSLIQIKSVEDCNQKRERSEGNV